MSLTTDAGMILDEENFEFKQIIGVGVKTIYKTPSYDDGDKFYKFKMDETTAKSLCQDLGHIEADLENLRAENGIQAGSPENQVLFTDGEGEYSPISDNPNVYKDVIGQLTCL